MAHDDLRYQKWKTTKESDWEKLCRRCGACCGAAESDPCEHLRQDPQGLYVCSIYENRFGTHQTISGKSFQCVPIRNILNTSWPGDEHCGYKK